MIKLAKTRPPEPQPSAEAETLFSNLLESPAFKSAPVLSSVLQYLWQHKGEFVSEYAVAVDALGRSANFDPKTDASIRVVIGRLRARLKEFNATESYPLKLYIPVGTHEVQWSLDESAISPSSPVLTLPAPRGWFYALIALAVTLAVLSGLLFQQNRKLSVAKQQPDIVTPRFWKSFLAGGKPPVIVIPSLVHFRWPKQNLGVRDLSLTEFTDWRKSAHVRELAKMWGAPELSQGYLSLADTLAGVQFLDYFDSIGSHAQLTASGDFQSDTAGANNTIFIGSPYRIPYLSAELANTGFYLTDAFGAGPVVVHDRKPAHGQPTEYREIQYSGTHQIFPCLILLLPPNPDGGQTLVLLGTYPVGLASMLATRSGLERLDEEWQKAGSPRAWEMVLQEEVNQNTVLKVRPIMMRALRSSS